MNASQKIREFDVKGETKKDAYLNACKKLAPLTGQNLLTFSIKADKNDETVFHVTIYTNIDMNVSQREYCKTCREIHCAFYVNENFNCNACKMRAFLTRVKRKADISKSYYIENLKE